MAILQAIIAVEFIRIWLSTLFAITMVFENPAIGFLDRILLPERKVLPGNGAKLEMVIVSSKIATTGWDVVFGGLRVLLIGLVVGYFTEVIRVAFVNILNAGSDWSRIGISYLVPFIGSLLFSSFLPVLYWVREWERLRSRFVVFTDTVYFTKARVVWLTILTLGLIPGNDVNESSGPATLLEEIKLDTDVERIGGPKTGWLRDLLSRFLTAKYGVASIFWPSKVYGGADLSPWYDHAAGTIECIREISRLSKKLSAGLGGLDAVMAKESAGDLGMEFDEAKVRSRVAKIIERRDLAFPPSEETFDLYLCEDPGLWNRKTGLPNKIEEVNASAFDILS